MRISVAMATYNGERFIREQLESLARQTLLPSELVIGDDGSTDRTLEVVAEFAKTAPFEVVVHRNETNLGFTLNFLQTAARCSGDLIAFCDQDNIWLPEKLERCAGAFRDEEIVLAVHSAEVIDRAGSSIGRRHPVVRRAGKWDGSGRSPLEVAPPGFSMIVRRRVFDRLWGVWPIELYRSLQKKYGNLFGHDLLLFWVARDVGCIHFNGEALALFRVHERNTTVPRGAFSWAGARLVHAALQMTRAAAPAYRHIAEVRRAELRLLESLCRHGEFASLEEVRKKRSRIALGLDERARLYEKSGAEYWRYYARLVATGVYGPRLRGGLGLPSAIKDLGVGCVRMVLSRKGGNASDARPPGEQMALGIPAADTD